MKETQSLGREPRLEEKEINKEREREREREGVKEGRKVEV